MLAGRFTYGSEQISLTDFDFAELGVGDPLADQLQGFSWLRDLSAAAAREKGARFGEAIAGRWLLAHGTRVDDAWRADLWGERILFWTAYAPYILSSADTGYRSALLNTLARGTPPCTKRPAATTPHQAVMRLRPAGILSAVASA